MTQYQIVDPVRQRGAISQSADDSITSNLTQHRKFPVQATAAKRILERFGYRVLLAADGEEAVAILRAGAEPIQMVISDVVMPRMSGRQLLDFVRREKLPVKFMFTSGYTALDARETASLDSNVPFLPKPWVVNDLLGRIRSALDEK